MKKTLTILLVLIYQLSFSQIPLSEDFEKYHSDINEIIKSSKNKDITFTLVEKKTIVEQFSILFLDSNTLQIIWNKSKVKAPNEKEIYKYYRGICYKTKDQDSLEYEILKINENSFQIDHFIKNKLIHKNIYNLDEIDRITQLKILYEDSLGNINGNIFNYKYEEISKEKESIVLQNTLIMNGKFETNQIITSTIQKYTTKESNSIIFKLNIRLEMTSINYSYDSKTEIFKIYNNENKPIKIKYLDKENKNLNLLIDYK